MFSFLTEPRFPKAALGIEADRVTVLALERSGDGLFGIRSAASVELPGSLLNPSFLEQNILSPQGLRAVLQEAVGLAGMLDQRDWSMSLPSNSARTAILTLENVGNGDVDEILDWKAEQSFGAPAAHLRISKFRISDDNDGRMRYFATAVKLSVIDEYETVFEALGWHAGLILPRSVSESNWLMRGDRSRDALLLSSQDDGFTAVLFSDGEPSVVRTVTCTDAEKGDEIYRLLMFYNDRFAAERGNKQLDRVMAVGRDLDAAKIIEIARESLGRTVSMLGSRDIGLHLAVDSLSIDEVAAPAGLAILGFR